MRILLIDDEATMLMIMKRMLADIEGAEVVGSFQNPEEALRQAPQIAADLVFIDIQIGQDNGLDVARKLRSSYGELEIVFLTSHKHYALESFDIYPLDYMVKPVSHARLAQTIARAKASMERKAAPVAAAQLPDTLQVRALGVLEVVGNRTEPVKWLSNKSKELFCFLLVHRGSFVSKGRLLDQVFPEMEPKNASLYLNTAMYQLRKALDSHGYKHLVVTSQEKYRLQMEEMQVDYLHFETRANQLCAATSPLPLEPAMACEAIYEGELFEESAYVWAAAERSSLEELYARLASRLIRRLLDEKRADEAVVRARKLVAHNELDEVANLLLLQSYIAKKDVVSAREHGAAFSRRYERELGLALSPAAIELLEPLGLPFSS
ncbi:response regulator [Paenibacillus sp. IB182496]|uniref:Response regulator n=1 Tax=Paenibacillus sabuli TaxID=2772509 RepID=A0A927C0A4_9BACL|nr:response regulator [Paenibacillus sabuli]MBD2848634.1 response regulator [Paenibacillus sabuli]